MADTTDLLGHAIEKNPVEFGNTLADILHQKAEDAIAARKVEIAQGLYASDEDTNVEIEDSDVDTDLDLEDLDVDDLDLEVEDTNSNDIADEDDSV